MNSFLKQLTLFLIVTIVLFSCKSTKVIVQPDIPIPEVIEKPKVEPSNETIDNFLSEYLKL